MAYGGIDVHKKQSQMCLVLRCRKGRLRTKNRLPVNSGGAACRNLLHNRELWQQVCATGGAMILGYARVSKGETQDTHLQEPRCGQGDRTIQIIL